MPRRFADYRVPFRTEESIANTALEWRRAGGVINSSYFDIIDFVENVLTKRFMRKGTLKIKFFESGPNDDLAFITYKPLILHVDPEVWKFAKMGEPSARHVMAHEIGHIILHDYRAKAFSNDPSRNIKFEQDEFSAEWQANRFADHFLVPDHLVKAFAEGASLAHSCSVPLGLANERFSKVYVAKRRSSGYSGEGCPRCNNFTLIRIGLLQRCDTCDAMIDEFGNISLEELLT